jgi:uncharacterized membrane protein YeaQ/YmgE (transglycosylase-associated protein family)
MIGMSLGAFVTLLVISAIWSAIVHGANYKVLRGLEGYFAKLIVGWIGGWVGPPVLGYWGPKISERNVFLIPAILGSIAAIFFSVATLRALSLTLRPLAPPQAETETRRVA